MKPEDSLYKGKRKFSREQKIFVVECILQGALDRIELSLPPEVLFNTKLTKVEVEEQRSLGPFERGALECAGMALGTFYAQLSDDGLGIQDALTAAGRFDEACEKLMIQAWWEDGRLVQRAIKKASKGGKQFTWGEIYTACGVSYPNCRNHAVCFVDWLSHGKETKW